MPFDRFKQTETITYLQMSNTFILIENAQKKIQNMKRNKKILFTKYINIHCYTSQI